MYIICHNVIFLSTRPMFFFGVSQTNFSQRTNQLSTTLRSEPAASLPQGSEETKTDLVQRHAAGLLFWLVRCNHFLCVFFFRLFMVELKLHSVYVRLENIFHPYKIKSGKKKHCWVAWRLICTTELVCYSMYLLQVYAHHIYRAYVWVCVCTSVWHLFNFLYQYEVFDS